MDAVLAHDFDALAVVLSARWLSGKDHSRLLARSRASGVRAMVCRPRSIGRCRPLLASRTKDKAMTEYPGVAKDNMNMHDFLCKLLEYYHGTRTHLSLEKDPPESRSVQSPESGVW